MRTLAIDCATEACSVALFDDSQLIGGGYQILGRGHAELLLPMIASLPDRGKAGRVVVALGPGSFTGVRVGIAAARALAFAWGSEIYGYSTLTLIAAMARTQCAALPLAVVTTGGHGEWFVGRFDLAGLPTGPFVSMQPEAAAALLNEDHIAGNQGEGLIARRGYGQALPILPDARCITLMEDSAFTSEISPQYGRPPDARLPGTAK
jgi:tRNA threonylcarbamoyladenosine biosynthesis protein TsaB